MVWYEKLQLSYLKYRHKISPVLFILSFFIDLSFVKDADSLETIIFIATHFVLTTIFILLTSRAANTDMNATIERKWSTFSKIMLDILLQFTFGAMSSALFVLYFRGGDFVASLPLIILLAAFLFGNEFAHKHTSRLEVRFASTIILVYAFLLYLVPLFLNKLGNSALIISSLISLGIAILILILIRFIAPLLYEHSKKVLMITTIGLFIAVPSLIFFDVIPPLPLTLREGTVVHAISKEHNSEYAVSLEQVPLYKRMGLPLLRPTYKVNKNSDLTFFTAIYAPSEINTKIVHIWKWYDPSTRKYVERFVMDLDVAGGRKNGYRTYSTISNVDEGLWRVVAKLPNGQVLGHRDFKVKYGEPILVSDIK